MKKSIFFLMLFYSSLGIAQQKIKFDYDIAGNQITRYVCSSCKTSETPKDVKDIQDEDLIKSFPEDVISFYPNPVKEELFIKWDLINQNVVISIDLFDINGRLIHKKQNLEQHNSTSLFLSSYPKGIYYAVLNYKDGDQKSLKIVKE